MKTIILIAVFCLLPALSFSAPVRVYCEPHHVIFEYTAGDVQVFSDENKLYPVETIIIEDSEIPQYIYQEQLQCEGNKLVVDQNYKPERAIVAEQKREQIKQAQAALDAELGKAEPDVITVIRLQRAIEQLKGGN